VKQVEGNKSPSIQYILFDKDSIIKRFNLGLADIKDKKEVDENTTYNAFSVTKTFTALAILQLAEQEKLDIEQPINKYLPNFPYTSDITIRQLLTHSAGIPNPIPLSWIHLRSEHKSFDKD
jgi:CubicO group peptidase (beta-lactamase class C family)